jgi:hypothetical protein
MDVKVIIGSIKHHLYSRCVSLPALPSKGDILTLAAGTESISLRVTKRVFREGDTLVNLHTEFPYTIPAFVEAVKEDKAWDDFNCRHLDEELERELTNKG